MLQGGWFFISFQLFIEYYSDKLISETIRHIEIVLYGMPLAVFIGVILGIFISSRPKMAKIVILISSVIMTIPSIALFGIMVVLLAPLNLGLGMPPAILAIFIYSMLPIIRNTYIALGEVDPAVIEAAKGMGLSARQILFKIKIPLSLSVIFAGIRSAFVLGISIATFAFLIAAGGLGYFIFSGINRSNLLMVFSGALIVSFLGIGINGAFIKIERILVPKGLRQQK